MEEGRKEGQKEGRTEGRKEGRTEEGRKEGREIVLNFSQIPSAKGLYVGPFFTNIRKVWL